MHYYFLYTPYLFFLVSFSFKKHQIIAIVIKTEWLRSHSPYCGYLVLVFEKLEKFFLGVSKKEYLIFSWNYNTNRNNMWGNFFIKVYWNRYDFEVENSTRYEQKTEIFLVTRPPTCWKPDSCFWFARKDKNRIKANL